MLSDFIAKLSYSFSRIMISFLALLNNDKYYKKYFHFFLKYNNKRIINYIRNKKINKVLLLLPHCIQLDKCNIKVTSNIRNCKECGRCSVGGLLALAKKYDFDIKIATGGTLARKYIKENLPDLIFAVACERDLISGIFDTFPIPVIGILNIRNYGPCYNTEVNLDDVEKIIKNVVQEELR